MATDTMEEIEDEEIEDTWLYVDEDSNSSDNNYCSDKIDSDIEAELYSIIHHHENLSRYRNGENIDGTLESINPVVNQTKCNKEIDSECNFISSCKFIPRNHPKVSEVQNSVKKTRFNGNCQKFSSPLKCKSISEQRTPSVILCSDDSEGKDLSVSPKLVSSLNKKLKKKFFQNSQKKPSPIKKREVVMDTSDSSSDGIIWDEPIHSGENNLKTNLHSDVDLISISSTSEDSLIMSAPFRYKELIKKNLSLPNLKIGEHPKDIWHVNDEDLYRPRKKSNRYHDNIAQCIICSRKGHEAKSCPLAKALRCFFCGGSHVGFQCVNRICNKCFDTGHESRSCWMPSINYCYHCNMKGHINKACPDIWRRYHLTTEAANFVEGRQLMQDRAIYCFNCGYPGHFGVQCKESRSSKISFPTWPSVISYNDPDELLNERLNNHKSIQKNPMQKVICVRRKQLNPVQGFNAEKKKEKKRIKDLGCKLIQRKNNTPREKAFPRSPKNVSNTKPEDQLPDSVHIFLQKLKKRSEKNKKRRLRRRLNKLRGENS